jgi:hypothetical protein
MTSNYCLVVIDGKHLCLMLLLKSKTFAEGGPHGIRNDRRSGN